MNKIAVISLIVLGLSGCSTIPGHLSGESKIKDYEDITTRPSDIALSLVGEWRSVQPYEGGGSHESIELLRPDGTFITTFKKEYPDGTTSESTEYGLWAVSGDIYHSFTLGQIKNGAMKPAQPLGPELGAAYRILKLEADLFVYQSAETGNIYNSKRIKSKNQTTKSP